MRAFSLDLRERVMAAYDAGEGRSRRLAKRFGVSDRWIRKLIQQRQATGSIAPKEYRRGPKPKLSDRTRQRLIVLATDKPDLTLEQLRRRLQLRCSLVTIWRELKKAGFTFKRKSFKLASKRETTSSERVVVGVGG